MKKTSKIFVAGHRGMVGYEGEVKYDTSKPYGPPRKLLDVSRIKSMGWEAKISLKEGIERTYVQYCKKIMGNNRMPGIKMGLNK